jgi:aryl-alcohol dehydrogenase-like predicted oxidoreductase
MELRRLGATSLNVSRLGLGLAALGRPGYINLGHADDLNRHYDEQAMEAHCHSVLDAAWDVGVRYFDAARSYGRAEAFLASWLHSRNIEHETVTVGSKWGYTYTAGWKVEAEKHEIKDHSVPVLRRQVEESRNLLGKYLKLYQIHSATLESGVLSDREVLEELARMREQGLSIGLTLSGPKQPETLKRAMEIEFSGKRLLDCVQATWNLLEPSSSFALASVHDQGMGVIIKEALANGRLTARNTDPEFAAQRQMLEREAVRLGVTIDALALASCLAQPWADVVLSGAATVDQIRSNAGAIAVQWDADAARNLAELVETPDVYWGKRTEMAWN